MSSEPVGGPARDVAQAALSRVLRQEAAAIVAMADRHGPGATEAVAWILACPGRVITCGLGKSGHIARKTAGTLSSTGTPSLFLHAVEALHGDLGMVARGDIVLMYTYSGESDDLMRLFPALQAIGARTIAVTGRPESSVARAADLVVDVAVEREACPNNLAPTTSTTAMLAMSDAIAVAVMEQRGFGKADYARFHPAGALGKRLLLTVRDVMRTGDDLARVAETTPLVDLMQAITKAGAGAACVVDGDGHLVGFVSDGDLRRHFLNSATPTQAVARDLMNARVTTIGPDLLAVDALEAFQNHPRKIGEMPVIEDRRLVGLLVLKDLLRSGIV